MVSTATIPIIIDRNEYFRSFLPTVNPSSVTPQREHDSSPAVVYRHAQQHAVSLPGDTMAIDARDKTKKDKKWFLGKLFRKKKKDAETSSSESEDSVSQKVEVKRKKTSGKKKRPQTAAVSSFDHIVPKRPENKRAQSLVKSITKEEMDEGVLSDPSAGFINYRGRGLPQAPHNNEPWFGSRDNFEKRTGGGSCNTSQEGSLRKGRKGRMKARVEAIRNSMRKDSSSDEDSQKSSASSSMVRFRSDDSLVNTSRDGSLSKRSRSARTERYIKRLSRDDENLLNKEAELLQQGYTKAEVELLTRTPTSQSSGYGTTKQENHYGNIIKKDVDNTRINYKPVKSESVSSFPSMQSYPPAVNFSGKINNESFSYSMPYNQTTNRPHHNPTFNNTRDSSIERRVLMQQADNVLTVKFPLGNVNRYQAEERAPPVPPPRDFQRKAPTPVRNLQDARKHSTSLSDQQSFTDSTSARNEEPHIQRRNQERTFAAKQHNLGSRRPTSEDQYLWNNGISNYNRRNALEQRRPASVSTEIVNPDYYANLPLNYRIKDSINLTKPTLIKPDYIYYADQCPRSRKPIHIQSSQNKLDQHYLSDSQASLCQAGNRNNLRPGPARNATDFWKKIDDDECQRKRQVQFSKSRASSDQTNLNKLTPSKRHTIMPNYSFHNDISKPIIVKPNYQNRSMNAPSNILFNTKNEVDNVRSWRPASIVRQNQPVEINAKPPQKSHVRHKSDSYIRPISKNLSDDEKTSERRKSTNLDDALNELEAIYNSLGLGDEDLLDRAERRELLNSTSSAAQRRAQSYQDTILRANTDQIQYRKKSNVPDKVQDDMAYRRLSSKDRNSRDLHLKSPQMYMLASPAFGPYSSDDDKHSGDGQEPDIIHDDVVFRNIKHANNHLKIVEPQPPFGIPIGPVSPAPQSDYLHVTPENKLRPRFTPRKSPDIVSDDLAYRSLRKDNKSQSLFDNVENQMNNNIENGDISATIKKKRAVRSLSANIFTMIQQEIDEALNMSKLAKSHKNQSISDLNKSLFRNSGQKELSPEMKRNKLSKNRHNTVNLFADINSNGYESGLLTTKNDLLSANKYITKPPISIEKSKSSSPSNRSPLTSNKYTKDEFQHVLSLLAQEAMDTSNKLGVALAEIDRNNTSSRNSFKDDPIVRKNQFFVVPNQNVKLRPPLSDLSNANQEGVIKQEKVNLYGKVNDTLKLDSDVVNTPNIRAKKTEDSLLAISDQLQKVESKLKNTFDREVTFANEGVKLAGIVTNIESNIQLNEENSSFNNASQSSRQKQNDEHMVQDLRSAKVSSSKKLEVEAEDLDKITMFDDLRQGISELLNGISQVNDKLKIKSREESNDEKEVTLDEKVIKDQHVDAENSKAETPDYNSSEELANIFKLDEKSVIDKPDCNHVRSDDRNSELNSPRLVQDVNRKLSSCDSSGENDDQPSQSKIPSTSSQVVPWRKQRHNPDPDNSEKDDCNNYHSAKDPPWYRVPGNLMLACSYTLVCTQQLAYLDWLTILGLILAMITIIAMLLI